MTSYVSIIRCQVAVAAAKLRSHRQTTNRGPRTNGRGMTLLELLVVIVILTTIVAAAIPIMAPAGDDRRLREATRGLNTFITGAQTRAIATGRPFGVMLKRLSQDTNTNPDKKTDPLEDIHDDNGVCLEAFYVEQPPPYSGFVDTSAVRLARNPNAETGFAVQFVRRGFEDTADGLPMGLDNDLVPSIIRRGDIIEVGGSRFELTDTDVDEFGYYRADSGEPNGELWVRPLNATGQLGNFVDRDPARSRIIWTLPTRFKVLRQPVPTSDEPHQLPEGVAIDLRASGVGVNDYFYVPGMNDNSQGILIMFTPEGRVARVTYSQLPIDGSGDTNVMFDKPVVDSIYLLVGNRENTPPPVASDPTLKTATFSPMPNDEQMEKLRDPLNWLSGNSRWVVIGPQSGRIVTVENAYVDLPTVATMGGADEVRRNWQIRQAREFTREMNQLGGR